MKKQILNEEFKRMQRLAGIITENQLNENMYYVYDIEGLEEPIGPFSLDQANNEKRKLGAGYDIMDEKTAKETWSYLDEAKVVSKEDKIAVIKEWIWYTCDEGQAKEDINKYNKMIDTYFADKDDVTKQDFKNIWNKVTEKYGVGDTGADSEAFPETWADVQTGTLVNM